MVGVQGVVGVQAVVGYRGGGLKFHSHQVSAAVAVSASIDALNGSEIHFPVSTPESLCVNRTLKPVVFILSINASFLEFLHIVLNSPWFWWKNMSPILLLSWFKCGRPPVSSTGAFRLSLSHGVTAVVHGFTVHALDPMVEKELIL